MLACDVSQYLSFLVMLELAYILEPKMVKHFINNRQQKMDKFLESSSNLSYLNSNVSIRNGIVCHHYIQFFLIFSMHLKSQSSYPCPICIKHGASQTLQEKRRVRATCIKSCNMNFYFLQALD